jgi:predicted ATPase
MLMPYISRFNLNPPRSHPFPYDIPAVRFAKDIDMGASVTCFVGENGSGKSTLLEVLAYRLQLPHMDGTGYGGRGFVAARKLLPYLELEFASQRTVGFFFRAEDFGDLLNSVDRQDQRLHAQLEELHGDVPDHIIEAMKDSANFQLHHVRRDYGQELQGFSHGEAYLHILQQQVRGPGIYLLDEPEAALSPARQLALLHFMRQHLREHRSQFIIATHAPIIMAFPGAFLYEIATDGMERKALEELDHYTFTKAFLNSPERFLRHLDSDLTEPDQESL